jgi:hypothetical protein
MSRFEERVVAQLIKNPPPPLFQEHKFHYRIEKKQATGRYLAPER